ncbi:putative armadillo repeat-containing protein 5 [Scophthalmus maximus]|uniref:Putative armadillo repeat-containing protein 5 n=1 Tax=Scophthalmus maximus TaxID=52904 RepID=A0A2U9CT26_SCOMX|nr:putative armadillo repeat-containing protein 5 [Scophthalmus maximus]
MAASPAQGAGKPSRAASRDGHTSSPEFSLTWCLAHLCKPGPGAEHHGNGKAADTGGGGRDMDKRSRVSQWRALVAIRTQHIKGDKAGIATFRTQGGLRPLLDLLQRPECSRKTLDLALSILANCCTEPETRVEVRKLDGIDVVVGILKRNVALETVQNRAARALGNLAMDPESSALIHSAGGVPLLLLCVSLSSAPSSPTAALPKDPCPKLECAQSAARALLYLSDTPSNRLSLLTQGTLSALAPLIAPEYPLALRRAALRTLHELTRGCGVECAREVSRSGVLAQLGVIASGEESGKPFEELALKTLANLCTQGCLRPLVGSLGVIQKFTEEVKKDQLKSGVFLKALCLCCKEAVNRAKVKESGGLEVLTGFLSAHQSHPLSRLVILACVDFVFDESAMEQLQELGLVPLLVARLVELSRGEEEQYAEKMDVSLASSMSPDLLSSSCFESFDFPTPESYKKEEAGREQGLCSSSFQSLRSWLVSEGLISSEGDLPDSSGVDGEWGSLQIPLSSRRQRAHFAASLTKVTLDTPPSVPRPAAYHHPYHPEPWTTESPILLLLSRFSHATDPSAALVSSGVMTGLLYYLTQHQDPSSRCFRMLCRLSCNPNCLQALVRTGSVALIRHRLCQREEGSERDERQTDRVKAKVKQLGASLLNNLRVQCESGFGAGVLAHVMMSGSESDKVNCALSLPLISSNKILLKKLLLDSGGLLSALQPLGCEDDEDDGAADENNAAERRRLLSDLFNSPHAGRQTSRVQSLYFSLLIGCLSTLTASVKTELDKRHINLSVANVGRVSPPPSKKPRLSDKCPHGLSDFDLFLLLDDGTRIPANREAVAGAEGTESVGSEYFRALLRGGFGEAQVDVEEAIHIRDVSVGMLLPVLHYLHGCRFAEDTESSGGRDEGQRGGRCQVLDSLVHEGLSVSQKDSVEDFAFQKTPLGEAMIGACRFLVTELQRELEDLCVSLLLLSCSTKAPTGADPVPAEDHKDPKCLESAEENLAHRTSELELTGLEAKKPNSSPLRTHSKKSSLVRAVKKGNRGLDTSSDQKTAERIEESISRAKNPIKGSTEPLKSAARGSASSPEAAAGGGALAALLPQVYWFSQRHSYPALGRACLSLLLGCRDRPRAFASSTLARDCLRRLAREADCADALKQGLVSLVAVALS